MSNNLIKITFFFFLLFIPISNGFAQVNSQNIESNIVNGTAEFLTERANDNFFYIFEKKLKDNKLLKVFFPNTYRILETTRLQILLTNRDIWNKSINQDLIKIGENSLNIINQGVSVLPSDRLESIDYILTNIRDVNITIDTNTYQLNAMPLNMPPQHKEVYKNIYFKLNELESAFNAVKLISFRNIQNNDSISIILNNLKTSLDDIQNILRAKDYTLNNAEKFNRSIDSLNKLVSDLKEISGFVQIILDVHQGNTYRVLNAFYLIEYVENNLSDKSFISTNIKNDYDKSFDSFKSFALFFTQLSEAQSKSEVKAILSTVTTPSVSFGTKRDNSNHFFLSSYWGISAGIETQNQTLDLTGKNTLGYYGITSPIGLEYSWGQGKNGSISIFMSIFDFAPAVNSQLFNSNSDIKIKDIVSPGIYLVYGIPEIPIAVSLGYFHSKSVRENVSQQHHIILSVAFDMPLMIFY